MKKILFALMLCVISMCCTPIVENIKQKNEQKKSEIEKQDSIARVKREQFVRDSIMRDSIAKTEHIDAVKNSIQLTSYYLHTPNSAGGCDMTIKFRNISNKNIKYVVFNCKYYNAVDDVVYCDIRDYSVFSGQVTGPIKYNGTNWDCYHWDCPIYNWSARKMEIIDIEIDYMDGTELNISNEEMKYVKGYKGRK